MSLILWEAIHAGTPFMRPVPIVKARRQTTLTAEDEGEWVLPPNENTIPVPGVHFCKRRMLWQVKIRNPPGSTQKFSIKTGFMSQALAVDYLIQATGTEVVQGE